LTSQPLGKFAEALKSFRLAIECLLNRSNVSEDNFRWCYYINMAESIEKIVSTQLYSGEMILWYGSPQPEIIFRKNFLLLAKIALPMSLLIIALLYYLFQNTINQLSLIIKIALPLIFFLAVILAILFIAAIAFNFAKKTIYLVTNRRVFTILLDLQSDDFNSLNHKFVHHENSDINNLTTKELGNDYSDIIFGDKKIGFYAIKDGANVVNIIKTMLKR
jgi:hypothetical protein